MRVARPAQHNQFVTVDEFVRARRAPNAAVSVEGYIVLGYPTRDGGLRLAITDSIDRVLNAGDAQRVAAGGAVAVVPRAGIASHPRWAWTPRGIQRDVMYTGPGRAQKELHDITPKVRITGFTARGRAVIDPATKIEYADDNGEWKEL